MNSRGDPYELSKVSDGMGFGTSADVRKEMETISEMFSFIFFAPRQTGKLFNTVDYEKQVISSVRSHQTIAKLIV